MAFVLDGRSLPEWLTAKSVWSYAGLPCGPYHPDCFISCLLGFLLVDLEVFLVFIIALFLDPSQSMVPYRAILWPVCYGR